MSIFLYKLYFLNWFHPGGSWTCSVCGRQVSKWRETPKNSTSWKILTVKTLMQGLQMDKSPIKNQSKTRFFSLKTLPGEQKSAFLLNHEFECREKPKMKNFLWKFRTIRILIQESKPMYFSTKIRLQVLCCWLKFSWRDSNWCWLGIKSLKNERNQNIYHFCSIWTATNPIQGSKKHFIAWIVFRERKIYDTSLHGGIIPVVSEIYDIDYQDKSM